MQRSCTVLAHILAISGYFFLNVYAPVRGQCPCPCPADLTGNTLRDGLDVEGFVKCVLNGPSVGPGCSCADMNADSVVDQLDIPFFASTILSPGSCTVTQSQYEPGPLDTPPASPCREGRSCGGAPDRGVANSLYLFNGEAFQSAVDLQVAGRGLDFVWARKYRSRNGPTTAMGAGWDYSYNIYLEPAGPNYILHDGNTRADLYTLQANGKWARDEYFRELQLNGDGTYTLVFANNGKWNLRSLVAPIAPGRVDSIIDRNSNTISFAYDAQGRLVTITDALSRPFTLAYDASNRITSVNDFTGRQVVYTYDANGDLRTVRSPLVAGTPNGNDYPGGKITSYTYSSGFADNRLNHNLLTITDPRGQTYLVNTYASTLNASDLYFDRIIHQVWGDPGDIIDVMYVPQSGCSGNNFAVMKSIVNDRVGDVKEFYYDGGNRLVMAREFTGRANPDLPTSESANRPAGKLRPSDPDYFETRWTYNADSLPTLVTFPNLNTTSNTYELTLDPSAARRIRGNLRQVVRAAGPLGGDQASITESFTFETDFGGCGCGSNFVKTHTDGRGNIESHIYDAAGNRTHTDHKTGGGIEDWTYNSFGQVLTHTLPANGSGHRRVDSISYYSAGAQMGYLQSQTIDTGGFSITTQYEYDARGNLTRKIHPNVADSLYTYNQLDQLVRELSREVTAGSGIRYEKLTWYDANDNILRIDIENRDENGVLQSNTHWTSIYEHADILNRLTRTCVERLDTSLSNTDLSCASFPFGSAVTTEYQYDANRNPSLKRSPMAVDGFDSLNTQTTLYDERDMRFRSIRASGSGLDSTDQTDYDGNGNTKTTSQGLESSPRLTQYVYDGYDRRVSAIDAMGNITTTHYDANGNVSTRRIDGELNDVSGSAANTRLWEATYQYDAVDRGVRQDIAHFDTQPPQPLIGDGFSTTQLVYADNSQVTSRTDDNPGQVTNYFYDTANRLQRTLDAKNNKIEYSYDPDSDVTQILETDKSDLGNPSQNFTTTCSYDQHNRLTQVSDNMGNAHQWACDSRGNRILYIDARNNRIRHEYDGLSRLLRTMRDMNGNSNFNDFVDIVSSITYDDNSRVVTQTDDNNNTTTSLYDSLNRNTSTVYADCTTDSRTYDVHDNVVASTDQNLTSVNSSYDALNRPMNRSVVAFGPGVSNDTTSENYQYDGLSRLIVASDNDTIVTRGSGSTSGYDSLSDVLRETQQILGIGAGGAARTITASYDGKQNLYQLNYAGSRTVAYTYDVLDRPQQISDAGPFALLATFNYIGASRVERRDYGNGTRLDLNYDGTRRTISTAHTVIAGGAIIDQRNYSWDPMNNKMFMDRAVPAPPEHRGYTYDAANRLIQSQLSQPPNPPVFINYTLDGVGNRTNVSGATCPGSGSGPYFMNPNCCDPCDYQMNQCTTTPCESRVYDNNGNLTDTFSVPKHYTYDYKNRLVAFFDAGTGQTTSYRFDALGRRVAKTTAGVITRFLYSGVANVAELNSAATTTATNVWCGHVLERTRSSQKYFYHEDQLYSIAKVTNSSGSVVEAYSVDDFGAPHITDASGNPLTQSAIVNPWIYQGLYFNQENSMYSFAGCENNPADGRNLQRFDPWGPEGVTPGWSVPTAYLGRFAAAAARTGFDPWGPEGVTPGWVVPETYSGRPGLRGTTLGAPMPLTLSNPTSVAMAGFGVDPDLIYDMLKNTPLLPWFPAFVHLASQGWTLEQLGRLASELGFEIASGRGPVVGPGLPKPATPVTPMIAWGAAAAIGTYVVVDHFYGPVEPPPPVSPVGCKSQPGKRETIYGQAYSCNRAIEDAQNSAQTHCRHFDCDGSGKCGDGKPCRSFVNVIQSAEHSSSRTASEAFQCVWKYTFECDCGCPVK